MKITLIEVQKHHKNRFNIYIDDSFAFGVSEETLTKFQLHKGMELSSSLKKEIVTYDAFHKLYAKAIQFISYAIRTEHEVRLKLENMEDVSEVLIEQVIVRLKKERYIDDLFYAKTFIENAVILTKKGRYTIRLDLLKKGLDANTIDDALEFLSDDTEYDMALEVAEKYVNKQHHLSKRAIMDKTKSFLIKKGYSFDLAAQVVNDLDIEQDEDVEYDNLLKQAKLAYRRYQRKYDEDDLYYKLKNHLYQKGFEMGLITEVLDDNWEEMND